VQLGLVEKKAPKHLTKPMKGHLDKAGAPGLRRLGEFKLAAGEEAKAGDEVKVSIFAPDQFVDVIGTSKGKGFQGVIRRHHFRGGRATHGSMFHRAPGSIGGSSDPSRVFPGMRAAGRMGGKRITAKNIRVVKVDEEKNLLFVHGAVPGPTGGYLTIRRAKKG
jgi:large subunit ribosomal protein L3